MRVFLMLCAVMATLLGSADFVLSDDALRCHSRLITVGDPADKLLAECGSPTTVDEWEEERFYYFDTPPSPDQHRTFERLERGYRVRKFVRVERWTYNKGPSEFIRYVRIENGRILKIETGEYGY